MTVMTVIAQKSQFRDRLAFWMFGMSNSFAFIVILTAARDIMSLGTNVKRIVNSSSCEVVIDKHECKTEPLSVILLAVITPAFFVKLFVPFLFHRIPFSVLHVLVCLTQATSYFFVAFSTSIRVSIMGVVFASISSGIGDVCYLALASHYDKDTIAFWSSGTGASGLLASLSYAALTEPRLLNLIPQTSLLIMITIPVIFFVTYFSLLTPAQTVYRPTLRSLKTWIVPKHYPLIVNLPDYVQVEKQPLSKSRSDFHLLESQPKRATSVEKFRIILNLLRYIGPLTGVYFLDFVINQGLVTFMVFGCGHGMDLSPGSQYRLFRDCFCIKWKFRWYQVIYCLGSFLSRSSINLFYLPYPFLIVLSVLETLNAILCFFNALYVFIPHIWIVFVLVFIQGLIGGLAYSNTYYRLHKEADPTVKEFSLAVTTMSDVIGIMLAGFATMPIYSIICGFRRG